MANPTALYAGTVEGIWLHPINPATNALVESARVWISGMSPELVAERDGAIFTIPSREEKISRSSGVLHLDEGPLVGRIRDGQSLTADEWLTRLIDLVKNQHLYRVELITVRYWMPVELVGPLSKRPVQGPQRMWDVSLPIRELAPRS